LQVQELCMRWACYARPARARSERLPQRHVGPTTARAGAHRFFLFIVVWLHER
jgi:hypothetical protein